LEENTDSHDRSPTPEYSICATTRNAIRTIETSLTSILSQLDDRFEVIVVDSESSDGTLEMIRRMQRKFRRLSVISRRCSRGLGRHIAYKVSKGRYLIQQVDSDVVYQPTLHRILDHYHSMERIYGQCAIYVEGAYLICAKDLMDKIGGWPDLQFAEDSYVYARLSVICAFDYNRSLASSAVKDHVKLVGPKESHNVLANGYVIWRDLHRVVPSPRAVDLLRLHLAEERSLRRKIGHVLMFAVGILAQYSKPRYKLHGFELQNYMGAEEYPNETVFYDMVRSRCTKAQVT